MKLGVFGGRFDPPHIGHMLMAQDALEALELGALWLIPAMSPPHKPAVASAPERLEMLRLAARHPAFYVSDIELRREGASYTYDTLCAVRALYPDAELYFIAGMDALAALDSWHRADEIFDVANVVALERPGYTQQALPAHFKHRIRVLENRRCDVSSSEIRERLYAGRSVRYLLPEAVETYLERTSLYR